jgi:cytochrome b561
MYSFSVRLLHKVLAVLIIAQLLFGFAYAWDFLGYKWVITLHKSFGLTILIVTLFLIIARLFSRKPTYSPPLPFWQKFLARIVHLCLYVSILGMALSGLIGSMLMGYPWRVFFIAPLPKFLKVNQELGWQIFSYHYTFASILATLVALHIVATVYHHFIVKDNIIHRMK